ncbi:hypothetical protein [Microcoleus sp.]|uniref:hypothetical protein n=1 Tax=Microcoleus sp. TaxID=44472 RepID=UPI0035942E34
MCLLMMIALTKGSIDLLRYILINYLRSPDRTPIAPTLSSSSFGSPNITLII